MSISSTPIKKISLAILLAMSSVSANAAGTLIYCSEGSPRGFDVPQYTTGTDFDASAGPIFNRLVEFKRGETTIEPGLAQSWEISPDGLTYTFHLRKGVKFHTTSYFKPTREFNADDVVFTFNRMMNKDMPFNKAYPVSFPYFSDMGLDKSLKSVEKKDDYTVVFHMNHVEAPFLSDLAMPFASIYSAEYAEKLLKENKAPMINQQPIGTGPFQFVAYQKDAVVRFKKNKDYFNPQNGALVDNLIFSITKDAAVRVQKLERNECQVMSYPSPEDIMKLKENKSIKVIQKPGFNVSLLYYNTILKPMDNKDVRAALDMAINKKALIKAVYRDQAVLQKNPMPPSQWSYNDSIKAREYNPEEAKKLLAKAGYPNGFEIEMMAMPVQRPYNPNGRLMGEMIQADWAKIGVKTKLVTYEWGEYIKRSRSKDHGVVQLGWTGDNGDPDNWLGVLFSCNGTNNANWCYKPFQELLDKAKQITDKEERTKLYEQAQVIWHDQTPASALATSVVSVPMRINVEGYKIDPFGRFNFSGVSVK